MLNIRALIVGFFCLVCFSSRDVLALPSGLKVVEIASSSGSLGYPNFTWPAINENGEVCYKGADLTRSAILKGNGSARQIVASSEDTSGRFDQFPTGICSINDAGDVAFDACRNCKTVLPTSGVLQSLPNPPSSAAVAVEFGVYLNEVGVGIRTIKETDTTNYEVVALATVNNNREVTFSGELDDGTKGIWLWSLGSLTNPFNNLGAFSDVGGAFINDAQQIVFGGKEAGPPEQVGIYGPTGSRIIGTFSGFTNVGLPVINASGKTAVLATRSTNSTQGENGVYVDGAPFISNATGEFTEVDISSFEGVSMNSAGDVVFPALRPNGNSVAFLAVKGGMIPLLEKGDLLPGHASPVSFVNVGRESINDSRQIAIVAGLEDGSEFVLRLDPDGIVFPDDQCPLDNTKFEPGVCGCGVSDFDSNKDGVLDCKVTGAARDFAQQLNTKVRKLKVLPSNASKAKKAALKLLVKEINLLSNQFYRFVQASQDQVKVTNKKTRPVTVASSIKKSARAATKTTSRTFKTDKAKALSSIKQFLKLLVK